MGYGHHVAEKLAASGNENILLTERGTSFGYNTLVSDMVFASRGNGLSCHLDATHSVQQPGVGAGPLVVMNLCRCWRALRLLSVLPEFLLKPIRPGKCTF